MLGPIQVWESTVFQRPQPSLKVVATGRAAPRLRVTLTYGSPGLGPIGHGFRPQRHPPQASVPNGHASTVGFCFLSLFWVTRLRARPLRVFKAGTDLRLG